MLRPIYMTQHHFWKGALVKDRRLHVPTDSRTLASLECSLHYSQHATLGCCNKYLYRALV